MEAFGEPPPQEKGVICTGKKVYNTPLTFTYKEIELSEDLNDKMEGVFVGYRRYLNQSKEPLPPSNYVVVFDVRNNTKEFENNLRLKVYNN